MPDPLTYSPEEVATDCKVMQAIWEQVGRHLDNKAQVVIAYATLRSMHSLLEIKVNHLESLDDRPIWAGETSQFYFLEKAAWAVSSFGKLAERVLSGEYNESDIQSVYTDFAKLKAALPNYTAPYGPFLNE